MAWIRVAAEEIASSFGKILVRSTNLFALFQTSLPRIFSFAASNFARDFGEESQERGSPGNFNVI